MRIINNDRMKRYFQKFILSVLTGSAFLLCGCGGTGYELPFTVDSEVSSYRIVNTQEESWVADPFAADLCVVAEDITREDIDMSGASAAALFDVDNRETLYAKNVHEKLYPASLTKVLTALVALKHGSVDMTLTATANVTNLESGAQTCGLKAGDQMTLTQALNVLLINSANDAAVLIAEGIAGSTEAFAELMNEEALALGATNSHFVNPHGLSDDNHYTTAYDMYLIMNEAIKFDTFNEIISKPSYTTVYYDQNGNAKELTVNSTNYYLQGTAQAPGGVTVLGGKTGTTTAAGHCLLLLSRDTSNHPYVSVILRSESRDELYTQMTALLGEIG